MPAASAASVLDTWMASVQPDDFQRFPQGYMYLLRDQSKCHRVVVKLYTPWHRILFCLVLFSLFRDFLMDSLKPRSCHDVITTTTGATSGCLVSTVFSFLLFFRVATWSLRQYPKPRMLNCHYLPPGSLHPLEAYESLSCGQLSFKLI